MSARLAALAAQLDAPLLVTNLTNVFYLTGFDSSNAALLVEPGGVAAEHDGEPVLGDTHAAQGPDVVMVERGRLHRDRRPPVRGGRLRALAQLEP